MFNYYTFEKLLKQKAKEMLKKDKLDKKIYIKKSI